jgi:hypothetical protein
MPCGFLDAPKGLHNGSFAAQEIELCQLIRRAAASLRLRVFALKTERLGARAFATGDDHLLPNP